MADLQESVTFKNGPIDMAAVVRRPTDFSTGRTYAALVIVTPGSSVKEQIGANYAEAMSSRGFVTIAFDPSYQGESGGLPRDLEDPAARAADVRAAIDLLVTLDYVDADRIGVLGVCAGGGYAVNASLTEHRIRAVGTVVAVNIGRAYRQGYADPRGVIDALKKIAAQRSSEAHGAEERRVQWIPESAEEAAAAGIDDPDVLEAVEYYKTPRGAHPNSINRRLLRSDQLLLGFDAFRLVEELLSQPVQVVLGTRRASTGSFEDGQELWERAREKEPIFYVEGAGHYDLYDTPEYIEETTDRLASFYRDRLGEGGAGDMPPPDLS